MVETKTDTTSDAIIGGRVQLAIALGAGFVLVPIVARAQPVLVNGFLILLLTGIILGNYQRWLPYLAALEQRPTK